MKVAVCITTYRRAEGLQRLLASLEYLTFSKCIPTQLQIFVIDNDHTQPAKALCEHIRFNYKWPLQYVVEKQRGISYARNRAILSVKDESDFIVFIDDDEVPAPNWLDELLYVQKTFRSDIVAGPVLSFFEDQVPDWIVKGGFFQRTRYPTGTQLDKAATGNVLMCCDMLRGMDQFFDERFALTGGEDTHFFMRLFKIGYKLVWANEALVYEYVPRQRTTIDWLLRRAYRQGNSYSRCESDLYPSVTIKIKRVVKAGARIFQGFLMMFMAVIFGLGILVKALQYVCRGYGMLTAMLGRSYEEYKQTVYVNEVE